jgi:hypothetical protein
MRYRESPVFLDITDLCIFLACCPGARRLSRDLAKRKGVGTNVQTSVGARPADSVREAAAGCPASALLLSRTADMADLCRQVGDIPGTDLPGLITTLCPTRKAPRWCFAT